MLRALKILSALLVLAALGALIACTSTSETKMRIVNALSNNQNIALDIYVNGSKVAGNLAYGTVDPTPITPAGYLGVSPGNNVITAFDVNTVIGPVLGTGSVGNNDLTGPTVKINSGNQYTLIVGGSVNNVANPPTAFVFQDDDNTPTTANVSFRIINASVESKQIYGESGLDVFILPQGTQLTPTTPKTISGLTYMSAGPGNGYVKLNNISPTDYTIWITPHDNPTPIFQPSSYSAINEQITTLVLVDNPNGAGINQRFIEMVDLN